MLDSLTERRMADRRMTQRRMTQSRRVPNGERPNVEYYQTLKITQCRIDPYVEYQCSILFNVENLQHRILKSED